MFEEAPLLVEDDAGVRALAQRLQNATAIGVDTEADSMYHYQEKVCLVQFTDHLGDIIVDPLRARDLSPLKPIFANPNIVKIFHGADYDVVSLRRDHGLIPNNLFDTLIAAQFLGFERLGLADLIDMFFGISLDKQHQRHDWSRRPLEQEHIDYARGDTHWLLALREILIRRLKAAGRLPHHREECKLLESRQWQRKAFDPNGWTRIKGSSGLDEPGKNILRRLYLYRDDQARKLDRPSYKVMGDPLLVDIAQRKPRSENELSNTFPSMRAMRRRHEVSIIDCVLDGLDDDTPAYLEPEPPDTSDDDAGPARLAGRAAERVFEELKAWRNDLVTSSARHSSFSVASNSTLKQIARSRPFTLAELRAVPEVRAWQVRDHGEAILDVLDRASPRGSMPAKAPKARPAKGRSRSRRD